MSTVEEARARITAAIEKKTGYPASRCNVEYNLELEQYEDRLFLDIMKKIESEDSSLQ